MKTFKQFSKKGYKHYTENTIEELDKLPLDSPDIITEFAHLREWLLANHGIWVNVIFEIGFCYTITKIYKDEEVRGEVINTDWYLEDFESPEEAYNAAFKYIQENNLI
jgi:hypothetical protein